MEESVPRLTDRARPLGPTSVIPETKGNLYHNRYHRWPAPTSAESAKSPHSERPRALGSYLISVRSVVRVYPGPLMEDKAPQRLRVLRGFTVSETVSEKTATYPLDPWWEPPQSGSSPEDPDSI